MCNNLTSLILLGALAYVAQAAVNIDCDSISNYQRGRKYCIIKAIRTNENSTITYEPSLFATFKTELLFDKCKIFSIPRGIFSAFPHLKTLYAYHAGLVTIRREDFENAFELREFDASNNALTEVDDSSFFGSIDLEYLNLASNRIRKLSQMAFFGLIRLKVLHIDGNDIEHVATGTFDATPRLEMLYMDHNRIRTIDGRLFVRNVRLLELHMHCNNISYLDGMAFAHMQRLNSFRVNDNPIRELDYIRVDSVYTNIRNIGCAGCYIGNRSEKLLAANNQISYVIVDTVNASIKELDLDRNRLTTFHNLTVLKYLEELDVSNNRIADFNIQSFANQKRLVGLRLRNSGLRTIDFGIFSYKPKLKLLDISHNQLGELELVMFTGLQSLRSLFLEGNNITRMDLTGLRQFFPVLSKIGISQNKWNCTRLALAIHVLEDNQIELNRVGLASDRTNVKGIPCDAWDRDRNSKAKPAEIVGIQTKPLLFVNSLDERTTENIQSTLENHVSTTTIRTHSESTTVEVRLDDYETVTIPTSAMQPTPMQIIYHPPAETITHIPVPPSGKSDMTLLVKLVELRLQVNAAAAKVVRISHTVHELLDHVSNN